MVQCITGNFIFLIGIVLLKHKLEERPDYDSLLSLSEIITTS